MENETHTMQSDDGPANHYNQLELSHMKVLQNIL